MISQKLLERTCKYYKKYKSKPFVVEPSLPILFFGDIDAYANSKIKIITVGKNPSDNEFRIKKTDPYSFCRFPTWNGSPHTLVDCLKPYFNRAPLKAWFSCYEPILNGADASYYAGQFTNRSIHTDICSPLATYPTWSGLKGSEKNLLLSEGSDLWSNLTEELQPDIILASIPRRQFESSFNGEPKILQTYEFKKDGTPRKKPYEVITKEYRLDSGKNSIAVWGMASNKPFDQISNCKRKQIGVKILELVSNEKLH